MAEEEDGEFETSWAYSEAVSEGMEKGRKEEKEGGRETFEKVLHLLALVYKVPKTIF